MKIGTKSLLFGVHQIFIHPIWVAIAWIKLYGWPTDFRIWICFIIHDWGYWGLSEMDGAEGDDHPYLGARIAHYLFDRIEFEPKLGYDQRGKICATNWPVKSWKYYDFCLHHSRFLAKREGNQPSKLCFADKYSMVLEPWYLYLPRAWASGELKEYMKSAEAGGKHGHMNLETVSPRIWYRTVQVYLKEYVLTYKDGKEDNITPIV